jgi:hypothetical protein
MLSLQQRSRLHSCASADAATLFTSLPRDWLAPQLEAALASAKARALLACARIAPAF